MHLGGDRWAELQPPDEVDPSGRTWVAKRDVRITQVGPNELRVRARWIVATGPGRPGQIAPRRWFSGRLMGLGPRTFVESVEIDGRPAPWGYDGRGGVFVEVQVQGQRRIELVARVHGDPRRSPVGLDLMPAVHGVATVALQEAEGALLDGSGQPLLGIEGRFFGREKLSVTQARQPTPPDASRLVLGHAAVGLTVGDAELRGRARLEWLIKRGSLEQAVFSARGLGRDAKVEGPDVESFERQGDRFVVKLKAPATDRLRVEVSWSAATPQGGAVSVVAPAFVLADVWRSESTVQLAREDDLQLLPDSTGWNPEASQRLPDWAQGLVQGTSAGAFIRAETGSDLRVQLLRFVPVQGPPVVVDVIDYLVATSEEGRMIVRARMEVRNDRAGHLRIDPPPGLTVVGARVAGETAFPSVEEDGTWRIPLKRSVESVQGLLSFPVEIAFLGEGRAWARAEDRGLELARIEAPVAVQRVTLHLPPEYKNRLETGEGGTVGSFSRGESISYGFRRGDERVEAADELYTEAVSGYLDNDFGGAQEKLDQLRELGADNANIEALQGNLDVVQGKVDVESQDADKQVAAGRVLKQAKARAFEQEVEQKAAEQEAERFAAEGRYDEADEAYGRAIKIGKGLKNLAQDDAKDIETRNEALATAQSVVASARKRRRKRGNQGAKLKKSKDMAAKAAPVGSQTSRDFTAVVDMAPTASQDRAGEGFRVTIDGPTLKTESHGVAAETPPEEPSPVAEPEEARGRVYDFEEDNVDGEVLRPEGATLSSRSRAKHDALIDSRGRFDAPGASPPPPPAVGPTPDPSSEAGGLKLAGTTGAVDEPDLVYESDLESAEESLRHGGRSVSNAARRIARDAAPSRRSRGRKTLRKRRSGGLKKSKAAPPAPNLESALAVPMGDLPEPEVHASNLAVVVPQIGEAVLYQRLLVPLGERPRIEIDAKRKRRRP